MLRFLTTKEPTANKDFEGQEDYMKRTDNFKYSPVSLNTYDDSKGIQDTRFSQKSPPMTSPGPNLEQKVPSEEPTIKATPSLLPQVSLANLLLLVARMRSNLIEGQKGKVV